MLKAAASEWYKTIHKNVHKVVYGNENIFQSDLSNMELYQAKELQFRELYN
jgi:hypothetical protein